jgi:hypothetical protein
VIVGAKGVADSPEVWGGYNAQSFFLHS